MLQRRYPRVRLRPHRALVASGEGQRLVMAGGGSSWMDLALYLIARCVGIEAAMQVARLNLIDWHHVGQQPFARVASTRQVEDAVIGRCQTWIADHYAHPAPVAAMTEHSGLAERSFQRRFKLATGMTPMEYVQTLRIEEAKHLLETTERRSRRSRARWATTTRPSSAACSGAREPEPGAVPAALRRPARGAGRERHMRVGAQIGAAAPAVDQALPSGSTRSMPSCAVDATSRPSRVNRLPRHKPRAPPALGESIT